MAGFVQDVDRSRVLTAASIMEEPRVTVGPGDEPRAAIRALRSDRASAAFVCAPGRKLVGTVTEEKVTEALDHGEHAVRDVMETDCVTAHADTPLAELLAPAARTRVPLAVVDGSGRLTGVIPRVRLLAALGDQPDRVIELRRDRDHAPAPGVNGGHGAAATQGRDTAGPAKEAAGA